MALQPNEQINLDGTQEASFLPFYHSLPEKPATTIRIFDRIDYYTVHGEDAVFTAKEVFKTAGVIKYIGPESKKVPSLVLNKANFEMWVRELLLVRQYRVEIYCNNGSAKNQDWSLKHKASPGNLAEFEEFLFSGGDTTNLVGVMAVKIGAETGQNVVGIGYVDATTRKLLICEFADNDHFSNFETLTVQLGPSECLIPSGEQSAQIVKIKEILKKSSVLITERKKADFQAWNINQDLNRLLELEKGVETCVHMPELERKHAMSALSALIKFLELLNEEDNLGHYKLKTFDMSQFVRLDKAAVDALQLMPMLGDTSNFQSLYGILNKCRTGQGQRLLAQWMKQPLMDLNKIEERHNTVDAFVEDSCLRQLLHEDYLRKIPDFQKLSRRFVKRKANLQDCYRMYQALSKLPELYEALDKHSGEHAPLLTAIFCNPIVELMRDFAKFQEMIELTMDLAMVENGEYVIKAEFDEALAELREKLTELENDMKSLLNSVVKDLGLADSKTVKLDSNAQLGYFFRVTLKEEKILRGNSHYRIIDANKTGVRFRNSEMAETNDDYITTREQYETQQKAVVNEVIGIACGYIEPMLRLSDVMAELDVMVSLAITAAMAPVPYVKPKLLPKGAGIIRLIQARHPCLELQENVAYIPNDTSFDEIKRFQIITGPNMGGKSTYMRTVGITVLLAQMGSFVPCQSAEISIVDAILTRIGCEDDHTRAISTFMVEMVEMASILRVATKDSLIIIDELGRGTSTYDGFGLAWAISEKIASQIRSFCMFATHFHELTTLEEEVASVQNLHVTATVGCNGPIFLYQIKPGVCDKSYGLHVAAVVRFPEEVLQYARLKAQELEDFQSSTLSNHPELVGDDTVAVKNRQQAKNEGERIIREFLGKVKQLDAANMSEEEIHLALDKLRAEVAAQNNAYVQDVLQRPVITAEIIEPPTSQ